MKQLASKIANKIADELHYDADKRAVIAYGLTAIFQTLFILIIVSAIGGLCGFLWEAVTVFLVVGLYRKAAGGAHAESMLGCIIMSVLAIVLFAFLSRYVIEPFLPILGLRIATPVLFALCALVAYKRVPVDCPNKPITNPQKIKRLRKKSFFLLSTYFIISMVLLFLSGGWPVRISASILLGVCWQTITLTSAGTALVNKLDVVGARD